MKIKSKRNNNEFPENWKLKWFVIEEVELEIDKVGTEKLSIGQVGVEKVGVEFITNQPERRVLGLRLVERCSPFNQKLLHINVAMIIIY